MVRIVRADHAALMFTVPFDAHSICEAFQVSLCYLRDRGISDILAVNRLFSRLLNEVDDDAGGLQLREATFCIEPSSHGAYHITSNVLSHAETPGPVAANGALAEPCACGHC